MLAAAISSLDIWQIGYDHVDWCVEKEMVHGPKREYRKLRFPLGSGVRESLYMQMERD